jgi:exodeoxyribonuclease I
MPKQTFLFYDIETTGLNPCFDQVVQFAAIRTDLELNEINRHEIIIKLNCDTIPNPQAMVTHLLSIPQIQQGQPEYDGIREIHQLMNQPGTISLGYNTLGFDDEFLRFSFYRNLLSPYTHQWDNQCSRMDLYPITILYYLYQPEALQWSKQDGKVSLKLENLNAVNQLADGQAHNAMVDVEATLELARRFKQYAEMWQYALGYFDKREDLNRIDKLGIAFENDNMIFRQALMLQGRFGADNNFIAPVLSLGQHQHYKNQTLWMRLDDPELINLTHELIAEKSWVIRKRLAEQQFLLPRLDRFEKHLTPERSRLAIKNLNFLQSNPELLKSICHYHQHFKYPGVDNLDAQAALYELNFPDKREEFLMQQFHQAEAKNKLNILEQITNPARHELGLRVLGRHFPKLLTAKQRLLFEEHIKARRENASESQARDYRGNVPLNINEFERQLTELQANNNLSVKQQEILSELNDLFIVTTHPSCSTER